MKLRALRKLLYIYHNNDNIILINFFTTYLQNLFWTRWVEPFKSSTKSQPNKKITTEILK